MEQRPAIKMMLVFVFLFNLVQKIGCFHICGAQGKGERVMFKAVSDIVFGIVVGKTHMIADRERFFPCQMEVALQNIDRFFTMTEWKLVFEFIIRDLDPSPLL